jgi:DNA-binding SARP family transcriptional activator
MSGFRVETAGKPLQFPAVACRLIACLALQDQPMSRGFVAGVLWPETNESRAQGSLRSTLWRVRQVHDDIIVGSHACLALQESVAVDARLVVDEARRLARHRVGEEELSVPLEAFSGELLPDWYDDWVTFERERFRLMSLQALEDLAEVHTGRGDYGRAVEAALAAVRLEPLRESAHRALIAAHIAQGNCSEALRQHQSYTELLDRELGLAPSPQMETLIARTSANESRLAG